MTIIMLFVGASLRTRVNPQKSRSRQNNSENTNNNTTVTAI